jgi:hypothetical protein
MYGHVKKKKKSMSNATHTLTSLQLFLYTLMWLLKPQLAPTSFF